MSGRKPIRVLTSGLTGRIYAVTSYDEKPDGRIVAKTKHDVSDDIESILAAERDRAWEEAATAWIAAMEKWHEPTPTERMYWPEVVNPYRPSLANRIARNSP